MKAELPENEIERLKKLKLYNILDTLPEQAFDDLATLASNICQTPISIISFVDNDRQWFKSVIGMDLNEVNRDFGFCAHAILNSETMIVPDATVDIRFVENPFVTSENGIRFYAGTPLITNGGYALGTLCVIDTVKRKLDESQIKSLEALSRQVMTQIENRKNIIDIEITKEKLEDEINKVNELNHELSISQVKYKTLSESLEIEVKNRTEELKIEKEKLISLLINAPAVICTLKGPEHIFDFANDNYLKTVGYRDVIGKSVREALPEIGGQGFYEMLDDVYNTGKPFIGKEVYSTIDKNNNGQPEDIYWNFIYQPIYDKNNKIIGVSDFSYDITEQVLARQKVDKLNDELTKSQNQYKELAESLEIKVEERTIELSQANKEIDHQRDKLHSLLMTAQAAICLLEGPEHTFTFTNYLYEKQFGKDLVGKPIRQALPVFDGQGYFELLDKVYQTGEAFIGHESPALFDKDGNGTLTQCYFDFIYQAVYNSHNQVEGISAFIYDVTDIVQSRHKVEQLNKELNSSNEELVSFAYIASHDLQEPLRTVHSYCNLLSRRYKNQLDEIADDYLKIIQDGSERMKNLIQDILNYSKIYKKDGIIDLVNLNQIIESVKSNSELSLEESKAILTYEKLPSLRVEKTHMAQLFQNIISNAIKYRKKDNQLKIALNVKKENKYWLFSISDNGIGISNEYFEQIFIIFKRLHNRTDYDGTGIGLSSCKKIVELYGGKIWVEGQEGIGSTFFSTLPV